MIGVNVTVVTTAYGQLAVIGTLTRVGSDYALIAFEENQALYELRIPFVNIAYVHANPCGWITS
ncbi:hypothetical protein PaecuDRAFT_1334 [Paenibacillus curdlanolyticus YK9]|uniref:Uncharacterized protein n=1 Tax=Paenibacillus curdlanolyticus YK9 TaxID=717606 RepID=E0I6R2_9BACL|nr:hypothetical protein [Paenibacillus curdlanolyticus]EFM11728.1 hypothetical protein PaecuDRAFT_1334 [Paenibacillus curdlanolyticus YK9]